MLCFFLVSAKDVISLTGQVEVESPTGKIIMFKLASLVFNLRAIQKRGKYILQLLQESDPSLHNRAANMCHECAWVITSTDSSATVTFNEAQIWQGYRGG